MGGGILGLPHAMERMGLIPGTASWIWTSFPLKNDRGESRHVMYRLYIYIHESLSMTMIIYDYHWLSLSMMIYDILITFNNMLLGRFCCITISKALLVLTAGLCCMTATRKHFSHRTGGMLPEVLRDVTHLPVSSNIDVIKQPFVDYFLKVFPWISTSMLP